MRIPRRFVRIRPGRVAWAGALLLGAVVAAGPARPALPRRPADFAACSSLAARSLSTEAALQALANLGFKWVELSCLTWAPHVSVTNLVADFAAEAARVERALRAAGLGTSSLVFDPPDARPFPQYREEFAALVRLAARLRARHINLMAPAAGSDRAEAVARLRALQALAGDGGVILTVETHVGQITERPADARWLCEQVPGLRLTLDPSHYYAGPHQGGPFDELLPLVEGTGFRAGAMTWDSIQLPWGEGPIDFAGLVRQLEAVGYCGFYTAEYIEGFNAVDARAQARRFRQWLETLSPASGPRQGRTARR